MKRKIKLTNNEKLLLIILGLIIVFWLFNKYIFTIQRSRISSLKEEETQYREEKIKVEGILDRENSIHEDYINLISVVLFKYTQKLCP